MRQKDGSSTTGVDHADTQLRDSAAAYAQAVAAIDVAIAQPVAPSVMLDEVLEVLLALFKCDRAWLVGPAQTSTEVWQIYAERAMPSYPGRGRGALFSAVAVQRFMAMVASGLPTRDDIEAGHGVAPPVRNQHQIRAQLAIAIQAPGAVPCVLGLHQCSYDRAWSVEECERLANIAQRLAPVLRNLHIYRLLQESEHRLAQAERIAHLGYWEIDLPGQAVRTSAEYCRIFGFADHAPLRDVTRFGREWRSRLHPDDRARVCTAAEASLQEGLPYALDYRLRMDDGEIRHVRVRGEGMDRDERALPQRWFGTAQDVTELRQAEAELRVSEARYRATLDHALDAVMLHESDGRIIDLNRAACEALGYSRDELIGQTPDLFDLQVTAETLESISLQLSENASVTMHTRFRRKDGSEIPVEVRSRRFKQDGRWQAVSVVRDISERQHFEEQLRQAQKREAVGLLAGGIAHEFNNLLMIILGHSEMALARMASDDPNRDALAEILAGGERAAALTGQLLAFSRQQVLKPEPVTLDSCLAAWRRFVRPLISEDIELVVETGALPAPVRIDRGQFEQAMTNLVINARDAMPDGGSIYISVSASQWPLAPAHLPATASAAACALITVRDEGHGMDDNTRARVFDPFFTTKPTGRGTGLGLAMVHGFVSQSGGHIEMTSAPGAGTCVRLYLPFASPQVTPVAMAVAPPVSVNGSEAILVVEDQPSVRELCRHVLAEAGYAVLEASDGVAALEVFHAHHGAIDLLLCDVVMPRMKGPQIAQRLAEFGAPVPILFMTGYADAELSQSLRSGDGLLLKPFHPQHLLRRVRTLLDAASSSTTAWEAGDPTVQ